MVKLLFDKEKEEWKPLEEGQEETKYVITIDGYLVKVLDAVRQDLDRDLDVAIVICGEVGSGKSNLARISARYVSNEKFHPKTHIVRDVKDIKRVFKTAKRKEAVIFDEASGIFSSVDTLTKKTKYASYVLDVCRQRNLFLIIVAPRFHRLKQDIALDRTKFLLRSYMDKNTRARGPFAFYGGRLKEKLWVTLRKTHGNYKLTRPKWRGTVGEDKTYTKEYKRLKDETLNLALDLGIEKKSETVIKREFRDDFVKNNLQYSTNDLSKMLNCSLSTIKRIKKGLNHVT